MSMPHLTPPRRAHRLRSGALGAHIDPFAQRLREDGYSWHAADRILRVFADLGAWLHSKRIDVCLLDESIISRYRDHRIRVGLVDKCANAALARLLAFLREIDVCANRVTLAETSIDVFLDEYRSFLTQQRGLAPASVRARLGTARRFVKVQRLDDASRRSSLTAGTVIEYVRRYARADRPQSAKAMCSGLRAFLAYLQFRGELSRDIVASVPAVAGWRQASLPKHLTGAQLETVLSQPDRGTRDGRRDYAILLLLSKLGLRANEVAALCLDDIDWHTGEVRVRRKGRSCVRMPLPATVGKAVAAYLRHSRPRSVSRRVFLRHYAPYIGFLDSTGISAVVRRTLRASAVKVTAHGAHVLRHTFATGLLREGLPLAQISVLMGHQDPNTTRVYAKIDEAALRAVAMPWPGVTP